MEWRPIETAPKDGARILLCNSSNYVMIGMWLAGSQMWATSKNRFLGLEVENPTHWMPLPEPPK